MDSLASGELDEAVQREGKSVTSLVVVTPRHPQRSITTPVFHGLITHLTKPIFRDELHVSLRSALELRDAQGWAMGSSPSDVSRSGKVAHILLAEDNLINQKVTVAILTGSGFEVDTVDDGAAAVDAAITGLYDVILMDCQMPRLDGYEATAAIRTHEGVKRHTPIMALTAGARREDRERCLAAGMDGYLAKPITKKDLLAMVSTFLTENDGSAGPVDSVAHGAVDVLDYDVLNSLRNLGEHGDDLVIDMVNQFVDDVDHRLRLLSTALQLGDMRDVAHLSHTIMGGSGQLGGRRLVALCETLERQAIQGQIPDATTVFENVEEAYGDLRRALLGERDRAGIVLRERECWPIPA